MDVGAAAQNDIEDMEVSCFECEATYDPTGSERPGVAEARRNIAEIAAGVQVTGIDLDERLRATATAPPGMPV